MLRSSGGLGKFLDRDFRHCRARYQRLRDAKFGSGWVVKFTETELHIRINPDDPVPFGARCFVEIFGSVRDAFCFAHAEQLELGSQGMHSARFVPESKIRFRASMGEARYVVAGISGSATSEEDKSEVTILDVSDTGLAIFGDRLYASGEHLSLHIVTPFGDTCLDGEVRYSRKDKREDGYYRTGLKILNMDRLSSARWRYFQDQYRAA